MIRYLVWWWRRRKLDDRVALQNRILGNQSFVGIDVGAAEGLQPHWWSFEGVAEMYLFEPHLESARRLAKIFARSKFRSRFHIIQTALGDKTEQRAFYMSNAPTGSSLFPIDPSSEFVGENNSYFYPMSETKVCVEKSSTAFDRNEMPRIDIAKLDVQGAELDILKGFDRDRLDSLLLVEAEVNIVGGISRTLSPYIGAPTWSEIDEFLSSHDMRLLDLSVTRSYRAKHGDTDWYQREVFGVYENSPGNSAMAWEVDVVYIKDYRHLIKMKDANGIRRLIVALGGYKFFSEAYYIVEQAERASVFTASDANILTKNIREWHRLDGYRIWHRRGIFWTVLRKVVSRLGLSQLRRWKQYMWFSYPSG